MRGNPRRIWLDTLRTAGAMLGASFVIALLVTTALALRLNAATAGFLLLTGVLLIGARMPLLVATSAALVSTLAYNFFFFPPKHTLLIEDVENWIALGAFLLTSLVANRLVTRERRQAERAEAGRDQIEALYELGLALLRKTGGMDEIGEAARVYLQRVGAENGGLILFGASPQQQRVVAWTGSPATDEIEDLVAGAGRHRTVVDIPSRWGRDVCIPLIIAGRAAAALVVRGPTGIQPALESAASLLTFAIEHELFVVDRAHVEAVRQASELQSSLIQAVSHDLKSPLTVLTMESEALESLVPAESHVARHHVEAIRHEVSRLRRRLDNLLSVARVKAGAVRPRVEPTPPADLFRAARESLLSVSRTHTIHTIVEEDAGDLLVDPSLALEIVVNLIENAAEASDASDPIELKARTSPERSGRLWIEVLDRGKGFDASQSRSLRNVDRADGSGRIGMDLSRTLAALSDGTVEWFRRDGGGTIARFDAPAAAPASTLEGP